MLGLGSSKSVFMESFAPSSTSHTTTFLPELLGQLAPSVRPCGFVLLPPCGVKFVPLSSEFPAEWNLDLKAGLNSG